MTEKKSTVYFTKVISPEKLIEMFKVLKKELPGKVGVKVHSGEKGNKNFIQPEYLKPIVDYVKGTCVECNTAYPGERNTTEKHKKLLEEHRWTKVFKTFDLMDAEGPDEELEIPDGFQIKKNKIGKNAKNYDSFLVMVHFKGHGSGGFGGALKQLSIGFGSSAGKTLQHTCGKTENQAEMKEKKGGVKEFKEAMADAAASVVRKFNQNFAYIALMVNISSRCDCASNAPDPCMKDIGILSSTDPVALDKACYDLIYNSEDKGKEELIKVIEEKMGAHIFECAEKLGIGTTNYEIINVD